MEVETAINPGSMQSGGTSIIVSREESKCILKFLNLCKRTFFFSRTHLPIGAPAGPMEVPLMAEVPLTVEESSPSVVYARGGA